MKGSRKHVCLLRRMQHFPTILYSGLPLATDKKATLTLGSRVFTHEIAIFMDQHKCKDQLASDGYSPAWPLRVVPIRMPYFKHDVLYAENTGTIERFLYKENQHPPSVTGLPSSPPKHKIFFFACKSFPILFETSNNRQCQTCTT